MNCCFSPIYNAGDIASLWVDHDVGAGKVSMSQNRWQLDHSFQILHGSINFGPISLWKSDLQL